MPIEELLNRVKQAVNEEFCGLYRTEYRDRFERNGLETEVFMSRLLGPDGPVVWTETRIIDGIAHFEHTYRP